MVSFSFSISKKMKNYMVERKKMLKSLDYKEF